MVLAVEDIHMWVESELTAFIGKPMFLPDFFCTTNQYFPDFRPHNLR